MSEARNEYRAYIRRKLRERGCPRDQLDAKVEEIIADPTWTQGRWYDYYDPRWVIADQPHPPTDLRFRLGHGLDVINQFLVLLPAYRLDDGQRHYWRTQLGAWLECAVQMRGYAGQRELQVSPRLYLCEAWEGPFEDNEIESVEFEIERARDLLGDRAERNAKTVAQLVPEVRMWHEEVASLIGTGHDIKTCAHRL